MDKGPVEALAIVISVIVIVLVALFGFRITNSQLASGNRAVAKVDNINAQLEEADLTQYDGQLIQGSTLLQIVSTNRTEGLTITVTMNGGFSVDYKYQASNESAYDDHIKNARTKGNNAYIAPSATFLGADTRNTSTKEIEKITFTLQ